MTEYAQQIQQYAVLAGKCLERQIILAALNDAWFAQNQIDAINVLKASLVKRQLWPTRVDDLDQEIAGLKQRQNVYDEMIAKSQVKVSDLVKRSTSPPPVA